MNKCLWDWSPKGVLRNERNYEDVASAQIKEDDLLLKERQRSKAEGGWLKNDLEKAPLQVLRAECGRKEGGGITAAAGENEGFFPGAQSQTVTALLSVAAANAAVGLRY
jgi:hypothetical protein